MHWKHFERRKNNRHFGLLYFTSINHIRHEKETRNAIAVNGDICSNQHRLRAKAFGAAAAPARATRPRQVVKTPFALTRRAFLLCNKFINRPPIKFDSKQIRNRISEFQSEHLFPGTAILQQYLAQ